MDMIYMDKILNDFHQKLDAEKVSDKCKIDFITLKNLLLTENAKVCIEKNDNIENIINEKFEVYKNENIANKNSINNLSVIELANLLQVSTKTIYLWIKENKIPYSKVGKFYRLNYNDVVNHLN